MSIEQFTPNIGKPKKGEGNNNDFSHEIKSIIDEAESLETREYVHRPHDPERVKEIVRGGSFTVEFYEYCSELSEYPENVVEEIKKISKDEIKKSFQALYKENDPEFNFDASPRVVLFENGEFKIYAEINQGQDSSKLDNNIIEIHFNAKHKLGSDRFGGLEISSGMYLENNKDFFKKLDSCKSVEILTDNISYGHTLLKVDDKVTSIQTFLEVNNVDVGRLKEYELTKAAEDILDKYDIEYSYGERS
jgi:hypothetical protein